MNDKFDELAKGMAQSVTRRGALKKFGGGLVGLALAALGLGHKAAADPAPYNCDCKGGYPFGCQLYPPTSNAYSACLSYCTNKCANKGPKKGGGGHFYQRAENQSQRNL